MKKGSFPPKFPYKNFSNCQDQKKTSKDLKNLSGISKNVEINDVINDGSVN